MSEFTKLLKNGSGSCSIPRNGGLPRTSITGNRRRFNAYSVALVCSVCLLMLIVSHRLVNSAALDRAPFLDISRTFQSWSNSEMEPENNFTSEIEEVVSEQQRLIAEEMLGYPYPAGRYNISARSLEELVPDMNGTPVRSLIITTWRSGSTFLGDVLNSHPGNYYHYEPLLDYDIVQIRGEPLASGAIRNLRNLLNCNYTNMEHYLNYGKEHVWLFNHNTRLWDQCQQHPSLCWLPEFLNSFCRLFPFQSMKVVRLRLSLVEELLEDPSLGVRVVLLVRDPRGTLQSRKHRDWCPGNPDCFEPRRLCTDLVADYSAAVRLTMKYPHRFRAVRYEDLSVDPHKGVQDLFQFFGLDFHPNIQLFLDTHTKVNVGGVSSTYRNSKSAPFHWRQDLTYSEVKAIQRACAPAMHYWGYRRAANSSHQKDFNPLAEFSLS
ncbi:carbohydrate sulfotransferase 5 isoform X2 [Cryptotermes secundus]|uniref:carbohydrate sulfotransferase 5 isoform X2 n=1 Tax=Cryptotermes secundus TaxID=105785 RepID=UPI000CD7C826|nr:carbohydrate sulfotransferase 5 isoform X2 [Cryptotermes secundus]